MLTSGGRELFWRITKDIPITERGILSKIGPERSEFLYDRVMALVSAGEVIGAGPGVFESRTGYMFFCQDCHMESPECPMLLNELFFRLYPNNGVVCFECLERKMGRQLRVADLTDAPYNYVWKILLERIEKAK